ncbi:MAG TPA: hypothetical protein VGC78_05325 [Gaiellaceae bacterium]
MIRALVLYEGEVDPQRYAEHVEVARRVPADAFRHGRVFAAAVGEPRHRYFAEFEWPDRASFDAATASPEWRASGKDAMALGVRFSVEFADVE